MSAYPPSDTVAMRAEVVRNAQFGFDPSLFPGDVFPPCEFQDYARIKTLIGPYTLHPTFYDADYNQVDAPTRIGRYGAIVDVRTKDGQTYRKYATLYRMPYDIRWGVVRDFQGYPPTGALVTGTFDLSPLFGLDARVVHTQSYAIAEAFAALMPSGVWLNTVMSALVAGLSETPRSAPAVRRNHPLARDRAWWYGLRRKVEGFRYRYLLSLPEDYRHAARRKWPLLVCLHGSAERGDDLNLVTTHGPPKRVAQGQALPFLVLAPQCPAGMQWQPEGVIDLLDEVCARYRVDRDRISLTGYSMGGFGTWETAFAFPKRFAALVPISGGGDPADAARLHGVAVWAFHGATDHGLPAYFAQQATVQAINAAGGKARFTLYADADHDAWTRTYDTPELYDWLLNQRKSHRRKSTGSNALT